MLYIADVREVPAAVLFTGRLPGSKVVAQRCVKDSALSVWIGERVIENMPHRISCGIFVYQFGELKFGPDAPTLMVSQGRDTKNGPYGSFC